MWLSLVCSALRNMLTDCPTIHKGAWKKTGLWPLDKEVLLAAARGSCEAATKVHAKPVTETDDADVLAILTLPEDRTSQQLAAARAPLPGGWEMRQLLKITGLVTSDEIAVVSATRSPTWQRWRPRSSARLLRRRRSWPRGAWQLRG
jgi:hypothetical protein